MVVSGRNHGLAPLVGDEIAVMAGYRLQQTVRQANRCVVREGWLVDPAALMAVAIKLAAEAHIGCCDGASLGRSVGSPARA
jgi:hypothetical protein